MSSILTEGVPILGIVGIVAGGVLIAVFSTIFLIYR